jgi:hypothetical protein
MGYHLHWLSVNSSQLVGLAQQPTRRIFMILLSHSTFSLTIGQPIGIVQAGSFQKYLLSTPASKICSFPHFSSNEATPKIRPNPPTEAKGARTQSKRQSAHRLGMHVGFKSQTLKQMT